MAGEGSLENYYSLVDLVKKIGKEGVAQLMAKGKPQRISKGDMIYFLKSDVNRLLGSILKETETEEPEAEPEEDEEDDQSMDLIIDDEDVDTYNFLEKLIFKETLVKRVKMGEDQIIYSNKILDMSKDILYGRSKGNPKAQKELQNCGIISSLHAKLYLDDEKNLLYENLGTNKSKARGCKDKDYVVLEPNDIAVLVPVEVLRDIMIQPQTLSVSFKIGYQAKPHYIFRVTIAKR